MKSHKLELVLASLCLTVMVALYCIVGKFLLLRGVDYSSLLILRIDYLIPFLPKFAFVYSVAWIYPFITLCYFLCRNSLALVNVRAVCMGGFILIFASYIIWIIFPVSGQTLINATDYSSLKDSPIDNFLLGGIYSVISPWNSFPSLHAAAAWYIYKVIELHAQSKIAKYLFLLLSLGIIFSTIVIKIHYLLDAISGVVVGHLAFLLVKYFETNKAFAKLPSRFFILFYGIAFIIGLICLICGVLFIGWHGVDFHLINYKQW